MIRSTRRHGDFSLPKGQVSGDKENHEELPHGRCEEDEWGDGEVSIDNDPGGDGILGRAKPIARHEGRDGRIRFPRCHFVISCGLRVQRQGASTRRSDVESREGCSKRAGKGEDVGGRSRRRSRRPHGPKQPESPFARVHLLLCLRQIFIGCPPRLAMEDERVDSSHTPGVL